MYTHIYIHIYSHEEASVGGEAAAAGEAGDGGNGYKDRRAPSFLEKKKEKEKLVARLKSNAHLSPSARQRLARRVRTI